MPALYIRIIRTGITAIKKQGLPVRLKVEVKENGAELAEKNCSDQ